MITNILWELLCLCFAAYTEACGCLTQQWEWNTVCHIYKKTKWMTAVSSVCGICGESHLSRECDTVSVAYMGVCYNNKIWVNTTEGKKNIFYPPWAYQPVSITKRKHADSLNPDVSGLSIELYSYQPFINWKYCWLEMLSGREDLMPKREDLSLNP